VSLAYNIAQSLGKFEKNGTGYVCCCPVHGDKTPSMSVKDREDGDVDVFCHVGCDFKDIKDTLRGLGLLEEWQPEKKASPRITGQNKTGPDMSGSVPKEPAEPEKESYIWKQAKREDMSHAIAYLAGRGITLDPLPLCLRWNSYTDKATSQVNNMIVCAASQPDDKKVFAVQRLFIDLQDHKKNGAKMHGICEGRGVWFDRKGDMTDLTIGEGVETVLSAIQATGRNGVAALSTSGLKNLIFPDETETIYILVDSDPVREVEAKSMPGQKAAVIMARRFVESRAGRKAYLVTPDDSCFSTAPKKLDFNDLLQEDETGESIRARYAVAVEIRDIEWQPPTTIQEDDKEIEESQDQYKEIFNRFVFLASENKVIDTTGHDIKDSMMIERAFTLSQAGKFHYFTDPEGKDKVIPLSQHWLLSEEKKTASSLTYRPGEPLFFKGADGRNLYNTFRFPFQTAAPLPPGELDKRLVHWHLIMDAVFHKHVSYIEDWFSFSLQRPADRSGIMPVCISKVGLGKSLIMAIIGKVIGFQNFSNAKILDVTGLGKTGTQWGDWIFNKKISCIEEIVPDGEAGIRYKVLDALKDIITNNTLALNLKGGRNGTFPIYSNIMGFSNHWDCIKIPHEDRRLFIVNSMGQEILGHEVYDQLWTWLGDDKNILAVYQYLMTREISGEFIPGRAKMTTAKRMMQMDGKSEMQQAFDMVVQQFPCDLVTPGEMKLAVLQALTAIKGGDSTIPEDIGNKDGQYNAILKSTTALVAGGQRIRVRRKGDSALNPGYIRAIRNVTKWSNASNEEIKKEMNIDIPILWILCEEEGSCASNFSSFQGQF